MNLFLLSAPYQILNALEAIHYFGFADNHLRIIDTGHFTRPQFQSVIDRSVWASVRFYDFRYKLTSWDFGQHRPATLLEHVLEYYLLWHQAGLRRRANRIIRGTDYLENLILGNYQRNYDQHMRHFANGLRYGTLYLLDVGTDTLRICRDRELDRSPPAVQPIHRGFVARLKRAIRRRILDWDNRGVSALTFFTAYDLTPCGADRVVRNDYVYLKTVVSRAVASDKVLFVGQPLADQGYVTPETLKSCLRQVQAAFAGQRLLYIPHPRESAEQLAIVQALGLEVQRLAAPFEYALAFSGERPRCVASFFSSVVENCATIFGPALKVWAFRLPVSALLKDREEVSHVYAQFARSRSAVIDIVDLSAGGAAG